MSLVIDAEWQDWIVDNLRRGCTPESMAERMVAQGLDATVIAAVIASVSCLMRLQAANGQAAPKAAAKPVGNLAYAYAGHPFRGKAVRMAGGRSVRVVSCLERPQIAVFANLLSPPECRQLIALARKKLSRATTVNPQTGEGEEHAHRTSDGACFQPGEHRLISRIEERLAALTGVKSTHGEGLQVLRYRKGGEYRPHFDYFPPSQSGSAKHMAQGGQRTATVVMYLSDVAEGGETIFPKVGLNVTPLLGGAVYFSYCDATGNVDPLTLHGGAPVIRGEKWIATKWLRQRPRS